MLLGWALWTKANAVDAEHDRDHEAVAPGEHDPRLYAGHDWGLRRVRFACDRPQPRAESPCPGRLRAKGTWGPPLAATLYLCDLAPPAPPVAGILPTCVDGGAGQAAGALRIQTSGVGSR